MRLDKVSSLKKDYYQPHIPSAEDGELGLENATFKWNEVAEHVDKDSDKGKSNSGLPSTQSSDADETGTAVGDSVSERSAKNIEGSGERVFEFSVIFPPGSTIVTFQDAPNTPLYPPKTVEIGLSLHNEPVLGVLESQRS